MTFMKDSSCRPSMARAANTEGGPAITMAKTRMPMMHIVTSKIQHGLMLSEVLSIRFSASDKIACSDQVRVSSLRDTLTTRNGWGCLSLKKHIQLRKSKLLNLTSSRSPLKANKMESSSRQCEASLGWHCDWWRMARTRGHRRPFRARLDRLRLSHCRHLMMLSSAGTAAG